MNKSKCIHFRRGRAQRTDFDFKIGSQSLETVDHYKYLGVIFHEKGDYMLNTDSLAKSAGRALGAVITKIHSLKDFGFRSYEKMFDACVAPIMEYCASVWGAKSFQSLDNVQNRALRYFLGVHRFAPIPGLYGDSGWIPTQYRRWRCILRYWNRLQLMDDNRLTKRVFNHDCGLCHNNWSAGVKQIMTDLGFHDEFTTRQTIHMHDSFNAIKNLYQEKWSRDVNAMSKLRTYVTYKNTVSCEDYVTLNMKRQERSMLCQLRLGILPLRIETGRYIGEPIEDRLCTVCDLNVVETEAHFVTECTHYQNVRNSTLKEILENDNIINLNAENKLAFLVKNRPRTLAKYVVRAFKQRRSTLYSS